MARPTVGSLFSGIGGFDLGLERAGFEVKWQCEVDPFCRQILGHHWPDVVKVSDVREFSIGYGNEQQLAYMREPWHVDLICGGFPCQDLSVAGKRAGLGGSRSGLWFEFHRILSELRPTFVLIENVPGLLSSNSGRDFGIVLGGLGELWPAVGWCVLDSQHFGVPQRRRRVYIIGGPSRESVQQILSLCEGGDWHPQTGREAGEDATGPIAGGAYSTGRRTEDDPNLVLAKSLRARANDSHREDSSTYVPDIAWALQERDAKGPDSDTKEGPLIVAGTVTQRSGAHTGNSNPNPDNYVLAHTLSADGFDASEDGTGRGTPLVVGTLGANDGAPRQGQSAAAGHLFAVRTANTGTNGHGIADDVAHTLDGANGQAVTGAAVRRLTPVECERLQGFPDGWTQLDGKTADGPRYRALGNAVTVPVIEYIGSRLLNLLPGYERAQ